MLFNAASFIYFHNISNYIILKSVSNFAQIISKSRHIWKFFQVKLNNSWKKKNCISQSAYRHLFNPHTRKFNIFMSRSIQISTNKFFTTYLNNPTPQPQVRSQATVKAIPVSNNASAVKSISNSSHLLKKTKNPTITPRTNTFPHYPLTPSILARRKWLKI